MLVLVLVLVLVAGCKRAATMQYWCWLGASVPRHPYPGTPNYCYSDWVVTKFEPHAQREALRPMRYGTAKPIAWGC